MYELSITSNFASAHFLRGYKGPCEGMHGHTWKVEVVIESQKVNEIGLVIDFRELKVKLKNLLEKLDHTCLNDLPAFKNINPSTENLAEYIFKEFRRDCQAYNMKKVRVWESDTCSVTYSE